MIEDRRVFAALMACARGCLDGADSIVEIHLSTMAKLDPNVDAAERLRRSTVQTTLARADTFLFAIETLDLEVLADAAL